MGDVMLHGVLNMPLPDDPKELSIMEWMQFRDRARQASARINEDAATIARLTAELAEARAEQSALIGAAYEVAANTALAQAKLTREAVNNATAALIMSNLIQVTQTRTAYAIEDAIRALTPADLAAQEPKP